MRSPSALSRPCCTTGWYADSLLTFGVVRARELACTSLHLQYLLDVNAALLILGLAIAVSLGSSAGNG